MKWFKPLTLVVLMFTLLVGPVWAQEAEEQEEKSSKSTSEVILTEEDFQKHNCDNVGDALQTISGVSVNSSGEISLRDVSASKVVVIMDGQRLNTPGSVGVNVASLPITNIEKIELLRGGRSAQYGADAVGGVILITTKTETESIKPMNYGFQVSYGSYNRQTYNINHSYNKKRLNTFISLQRDLWDGDFPYTDYYGNEKILKNNEQSSYNLFAKAGYRLAEGKNLSLSTNWYNADNGTPGMIDNPTPNARLRYDNKSYNLTYDQAVLFRDFNLKAQSYFLDYETKFDDPDALGGGTHSDHDNYALGLELQQGGTIGEFLNVSYGYSYRNDRIESTDVGEKTRNTHSAHTSFTGILPLGGFISQLESSIALRYDATSDFENALSPRLSLSAVHQGVLNLSLVSHIAKSYKAPSFNDLYWPRDAFAVGNPNLMPEDGFNYDIGLTAGLKGLSVSANYFRNEIDNLILWAQDPFMDNLWTPKNISETSTQGVETSGTLDLFNNSLVLNAEYTYMKALDKGPDPNRHNKYITYRPKNKLDLTSTIRFKGLEWNFMVHYVGLRYTNPANTLWLPQVTTYDTNISYRFPLLKIQWASTLEVTNLMDENYMKVRGTAEPGRMYKITLGANF
ncbi:TonB-dependent receptor plug domain-containing protein [Fidelibacter multiformis]|jgi:outer membrane receptor for ferrienterochelin and colicins|uniref:TonB-dependent receptor plug domain-containing protein n=1 Tax=Fidelibacter multiformis TaxID=3377529 RepID=UPI0037DC3114